MSTVDEIIEQDNAELRKKYLTEFRCYTADEIRGLASSDSNDTHDYASVWENQNKIFSVSNDGVDVFPSFQFQDGKPLEIIEYLLAQMPDDMGNWQIAYWFSFGNSYIEDERAPKDSFDLKDDLAAAVKALSEEIYW